MEPEQRVDLHVHSRHSGRFNLYVLRSLEVEECYTEPRALHDACLARGMTMVTITDHDTIDGGLEIAHLGDHVFLSEEVSARFPENGCIVHVLVYGIDEGHHREIQRLRTNIYELVAYLRREQILHSLAHPFSVVNQRLGRELLQKCLVLFDTLEVVNGQKDPHQERLVRDVIAKVDDRVLARWAERHALEHLPGRWWRTTAGSDDHSGLTMTRAHVGFDGPPTFAALARAVRGGDVRIAAMPETNVSYAHTAVAGTVGYFRNRRGGAADQTFMRLVDTVRAGTLPDDPSLLPPVLQRLLPAALQTLAEAPRIPDVTELASRGHDAALHDELYGLAERSLLRAFRDSFARVQQAIERNDPEPIIDELPTVIRLALFNLPYYFGFRFFYGERRRARALHQGLALGGHEPAPRRAAVFCDTLDNVDGVGLGLRRVVAQMQAAGHEVSLCGVDPGEATMTHEADGIVRFPALASFPLPGYGEYTLGWPSLLETMRWLDEREVELVVLTTPGPVGIVAMLAARILGIPAIGQYHTNLAEYAARIIGDRSIARLVAGYTGWFYGALAEVIAPTHAAARVIVEQGVRPDRIAVIERGVDTELFHPRRADPSFWPRHGLTGEHTLLYVGRISREKNVGFLAEIARELQRRGRVPFELAIVGDGPHADVLRTSLAGVPAAFTGVLEGEALATAFASSALFVFPSTTDTFGNVVLESLACGTPACVSDVGGPAEIVHQRETGLVLSAGDLQRWCDAIELLLLDQARRRRMAANARTYAETRGFAGIREQQWQRYARHIDEHRASLQHDLR